MLDVASKRLCGPISISLFRPSLVGFGSCVMDSDIRDGAKCVGMNYFKKFAIHYSEPENVLKYILNPKLFIRKFLNFYSFLTIIFIWIIFFVSLAVNNFEFLSSRDGGSMDRLNFVPDVSACAEKVSIYFSKTSGAEIQKEKINVLLIFCISIVHFSFLIPYLSRYSLYLHFLSFRGKIFSVFPINYFGQIKIIIFLLLMMIPFFIIGGVFELSCNKFFIAEENTIYFAFHNFFIICIFLYYSSFSFVFLSYLLLIYMYFSKNGRSFLRDFEVALLKLGSSK